MALKDKLVNLEDLKAAYDNLKEMIEEMGGFSSANVPVSVSGVTGTIVCNKYGHMVEIEITLTSTSGPISSGTTLGTVPSGYRPKSKIYCRTSEMNTSDQILAYLNTDGTIVTVGQIYTIDEPGKIGMSRFWFLTD